MWWKTLSAFLLVYAIIAGMLIPLKPGIAYVSPQSAKSGQQISLQFHGYNTYYTAAPAENIRIWLQYDATQAVMAHDVTLLSDTTVAATFDLPSSLPRTTPSVMLNAIIDHPVDGVSLLPSAIEVRADTSATATTTWTAHPVDQLHIVKDVSFPYRNVIYETIRNTYYHVPMWFSLLIMFLASVVYSVRYLRSQNPADDRRAVAFTEVGLLFGIMGLITGMMWAHFAWGAAWSNDIKQLMTAVALLIYLAYFILRTSFDEPEKGARLAAVYNIFAFSSLIPLLYIVPRMFASLHPGATGSPAFGSQDLDNTMRLVFYPAILGFILLGTWITQLRYRHLTIQDKVLGID